MSDDIIKKALGMSVESQQEDLKPVVVYQPASEDEAPDETDKDLDFARDNMIELIAMGSEATSELLAIAKQSQHPRAFEVVANLLKTTSELNNDLIGLHKKRQDLNKEKPGAAPKGGTVNNNLFVGSTAELHKMLANIKANGTPEQ